MEKKMAWTVMAEELIDARDRRRVAEAELRDLRARLTEYADLLEEYNPGHYVQDIRAILAGPVSVTRREV